MHHLLDSWINALKYGSLVLLGAALLFSALEQNFSFRKFKKPWKATVLDLEYFFAGLLYPPVVNFGLAALFGFFAIRRNGPPAGVSAMVFAAELVAVLVACDILAYVRHRFFHSKTLWTFHSIHHASEQVNWSSGPRLHPAESIIDVIGETLVFMIAAVTGTDRTVLLVAGLLIGIWNFFIHSNTRWTFGPLRYVLVSPVQHRWHHSDDPEAMDKNFAVMFSCIDVLMGTFYMPPDRVPKTTGLYKSEKNAIPRSFLAQIVYPFKRMG